MLRADLVKSEAPPASPGVTRARGAKRARILDAAITVFARTGYHDARVSDIAREAGIAYGLVYHYFRNKEEILETIFEERWTGFVETVEAIAEAETRTEEKLEAIAALILGAYRIRRDWVKVFVLEIQRSSRFAEPGQLRAVGRFFQAVAKILRAGQARGELRGDIDPDVAGYVFVGGLEIVITALVLGVIRESDADPEAYPPKVARTVVEIFLRGIGARS
jgi:TetR/AcrR family transcriptional regulator, fatty acid metabolism regulator protein